MAAYYVIQPLRDEVGLILGEEQLPSLFRWSMVTMLLVSPCFAWPFESYPDPPCCT